MVFVPKWNLKFEKNGLAFLAGCGQKARLNTRMYIYTQVRTRTRTHTCVCVRTHTRAYTYAHIRAMIFVDNSVDNSGNPVDNLGITCG